MRADTRRTQKSRAVVGLDMLEGRQLLSSLRAPLASQNSHHAQVRRVETPRPTADRWSWMANTYWYVPTANLPAVIYEPSSGALIPVADQTVFHIAGYRRGYFWGETVAQFGSNAPSSSALVGSVTPQGRVLLSFTSSSGTTTGYGVMARSRAGWTMENQMFSGSSDVQIGHWAYMVQTRPGMASWRSLPSVGVSVPTFLGNYTGPSPSPVIGGW